MIRCRFANSRLSCLVLGLAVALSIGGGTSRAGEAPSTAASQHGFLDRVYTDEDGQHKYVVFVPYDYSPNKAWPVVLFLHGAGERGTDGRAQTAIGLGPAIKVREKTFPFLAVFPQCEKVKGRILTAWSAKSPDGKRALKILDDVQKQFRIDKDRQVLTGWSMGGYGVWSLAAATPKRWSAVVPLAGGGDTSVVKALTDLPLWAFHGTQDGAVRPEESRKMIAALKAAGGNPRYDELPDAGHDIWRTVYDDDALYTWMLNPSTANASRVRLSAKPGQKRLAEPNADEPFVPAVEITNAVYVRMGNQMLEALAVSVPEMIPPDLLTGQIDDMYDYTYVEGRNFQVTFSGITYQAQLPLAHIKAHAKDRLNIQLALENVVLTVGSTYVVGSDHSAVAGPINVVIGHQRPVWLSFDVTPYIENRKVRLKFVAARFDIPYDNWYVTSPAGVSTRGWGMTRSKVSRGLIDGLYGSKARIEQEITALVPSMLGQLEDKLVLTELDDLVSSLWPLPVYRPRIQVWPEEVVTDEKGITAVLGVAAAAIDPKSAPSSPKRIESIGRSAGTLPRGTGLQVGVAPDILRPLTDLLIQADMARIHVLDIPEKAFQPFADPVTLVQAIPDLKRYGDKVEVWSEFILAEPLTAVDVPTTNPKPQEPSDKKDKGTENAKTNTPQRLEFRLPKVLISLAIRTKPDSDEWTPYAELDIHVSQKAIAEAVTPDSQHRALRLAWFGEPEIRVVGRFAPDYRPQTPTIDVKKFTELFATGWRGWTSIGPASQTTVPDIDFGLSKLRLSSAGWSAPHLYVGFSPPGVKITNATDKPFDYDVKGPQSGWGGPYTLEPGDSHEYEVAYAMLYRRRTPEGEVLYTLPAGSHSKFRVPSTGGAPGLYLETDETPEDEAGAEDGASAKPEATKAESDSQ